MGTPWWWHIGGPAIAAMVLVAPWWPAAEAVAGSLRGGPTAEGMAPVPPDLRTERGLGVARATALRVAQHLDSGEANPPLEQPGNAAALYRQLCATCHGTEGRGDGPAAANMAVKPRDHTDPVYMGSLTDEQIFDIIKRGGAAVGKFPAMPAWGHALSEPQIRELVHYIRSLNGLGR